MLHVHIIQVSDHCIVLHWVHLPIYLCAFPVMDTQVAVNSQQCKTLAVHILVHTALWTLWDYLCCTDPEVEILDHKLYVYLIFYISTKLISSIFLPAMHENSYTSTFLPIIYSFARLEIQVSVPWKGRVFWSFLIKCYLSWESTLSPLCNFQGKKESFRDFQNYCCAFHQSAFICSSRHNYNIQRDRSTRMGYFHCFYPILTYNR